MNASLGSLVNNLSGKIYNTNYNQYIKCKDCKKIEGCGNDSI